MAYFLRGGSSNILANCVDWIQSLNLSQQMSTGHSMLGMEEDPHDLAIGKPDPMCGSARVRHR